MNGPHGARWIDHPDMPHAYRILVRVDDSGAMHIGGVCDEADGPGVSSAPRGASAWWWVGQRPVNGIDPLTMAWGWAQSPDDAEKMVAVVAAQMGFRGMVMDTESARDFRPIWDDE